MTRRRIVRASLEPEVEEGLDLLPDEISDEIRALIKRQIGTEAMTCLMSRLLCPIKGRVFVLTGCVDGPYEDEGGYVFRGLTLGVA